MGCLTGQNKNRPLHSGPYTEDFDFAIVDTPMHHALMHKSNFWSKIKSDLKPLEEHCAEVETRPKWVKPARKLFANSAAGGQVGGR